MKLSHLGIFIGHIGFSGLLPLPLGEGVEGGRRSSGGMGHPGPQFPHLPWPPTWCPAIPASMGNTLHLHIWGSETHLLTCWQPDKYKFKSFMPMLLRVVNGHTILL